MPTHPRWRERPAREHKQNQKQIHYNWEERATDHQNTFKLNLDTHKECKTNKDTDA